MEQSRRNFLAALGVASALLVASRPAMASNAVCYDPSELPLNLKNRRKALGFVEQAPDAKRRCGLCAFFQAKDSDCGSCQLLSGGFVTAKGVCNSFAPTAG